MNELETVNMLVKLLQGREPFVHVRFGDGDIMFMSGTGSVITGDGEEWSRDLQSGLLVSWLRLASYTQGFLLLGDVETYAVSDGVEKQWWMLRTIFDQLHAEYEPPPVHWAHMEALRVGFGYARPFYEAFRDDPREKALVAPAHFEEIAQVLGCEHVEVPLHVAWQTASDTADYVRNFEVAAFAAGRGGKIMQGILADTEPGLVQIDIGSGLDILLDEGVRRGTDLGLVRSELVREYREAGLCP